MNQIGCSTGLLSHPDKESEAEQCKIKKKKKIHDLYGVAHKDRRWWWGGSLA